MILGGPDPDCVAGVARNLTLAELDTVHLVSVGGWDQQHPDTSRPPVEVWETLKSWNEKVIARPHLGFSGYDGFDWDIEGSDSPSDAANAISVELLEMIGAVSKMAKREGYVVSMAPLESYLDPSTSLFNRSLQQTYPEWESLAPGFKFHGRKTLAPSKLLTSSPLTMASPPPALISSATCCAGETSAPLPSTPAPRSFTTILAPALANCSAC